MRRRLATMFRSPLAALAVLVGAVACSGIITGPDAGPDTRPRSIRVTPSTLDLSLGETATLATLLYDASGAETTPEDGRAIEYVSADPSIATVTAAGLVTAIADGTVRVRAAYGALGLDVPVTVRGRSRLVVVSGSGQTAEQGDPLAAPLVVRAVGGNGAPIADASIAFTLNRGGQITPATALTDAAGEVRVQWRLGVPLGEQTGAARAVGFDSVAFTATATAGTRPTRIGLSVARSTLIGAGDTETATAVAYNVADVVLPSATITWASTVTTVATVNSTGVITAVAPGQSYIRASAGDARDSVLVTVVALPVIGVAPTSVTASADAGAVAPSQTIAVTNTGGSVLNGLSVSIAYAPGAAGWLTATLNQSAAPATLTVTPNASALTAGTYTATLTLASTDARVATRAIPVTFTVTSVAPLPKLDLGADRVLPAGLQSLTPVRLPASAAAPVSVTLTVADAASLLLSNDAFAPGAASASMLFQNGRTDSVVVVQALEGRAGRTVAIIADAAGYAPDTMQLTIVRPTVRLSRLGSGTVPSIGGDEPVLLAEVGVDNAGFTPLAVRAGAVVPTFTLGSSTPTTALLRHVATAFTVGADQGPATAVTFAIAATRSATSRGDIVGVPASLVVPRTGAAGVATLQFTSVPSDYLIASGSTVSFTIVDVTPVIAVAPTAVDFTMFQGDAAPPAQTVTITNVGNGTLTGLSAFVTYDAGATGWLTASLSGSAAPSTLTLTPGGSALAVGTYTATVTIVSTVSGVAAVQVPVTLTVTSIPTSPKLDLGVDRRHPARLQTSFSVARESAGGSPLDVTLTTSDVSGVRLSTADNTVGAASVSVQIAGGSSSVDYWVQGVEGGAGRTVLIIATATGYEPDTLVVTTVNPEFRLTRLGAASVPVTGGEDPILQLTLGGVPQSGGAFVPMAVSAGLPAQEFTLTSTTPAIAQLRFFATASTVGADQGPASSVTFSIPAGGSVTSIGTPASLRMARTGTAGVASVTATATAAEWVPNAGFATATATFTPVGVPRIVIVSGNNQSVAWGEFAPDSLVVQVLDAAGLPVAGALVNFTVSANGGTVSPTSETTDANGRVATRWRVATALGTYTVTASRAGYENAVFTGTVIAGATITRVAVTVPRTTMTGAGDSFLATATAYNLADSVITSSPTAWSSSAAAVLTVSTDGLVTSVAAGSAYVIAEIAGVRDSVLVTVVEALDIALGAQAYTAAGLMNETVETFAPAPQAYSLVLRSLDPAVALLSTSANAAGTASITIPITAGTASFSWWAHGLEGAGNGSVSVVAEIAGVEVDTVQLTVVAPKMRVGSLGALTLPASGGRDPWFGVTIGGDVAPVGAGLAFRALAVRIGGTAPSFTMTSSDAAIAQLRFRVTPNTTGSAQGPATSVTFGIQPGFSSTFLPGYDSGELPSVEMSRPGGAGTATIQLTGPAGYTLDGALPTVTTTPVGPPAITLALVNTPLVGVNGTATVRATLAQPAPVGGVSVTLVSGDINRATVNSPSTVFVSAGATIADFVVTGISTGNVTLTATASGYANGTLIVNVSTNTISVPLTLNVPYTRTASLPITLTQPAPVGGTTINVVSGDPAVVRVNTPNVFIAAGALSGNAQLEGLQLGQVAVVATGPNLATGTSSVRVTAALDIIETNISINAGFSVAQFTTRLLSGGTPFSAPTGGIPVTYVARNSACIAAPTGVSVAAGQNSVVATAEYGGTASLTCSTYLVATSPAFDPDSVLINVGPQPTTSLSMSTTIGAGLLKQGSISLSVASPAGGTLVTLSSSDPTRMVVAPNATTVGTGSIQITIPPGSFSGSFWFAGIENQGNTTAQLSATVQRYVAPPPVTVAVRPLGIESFGSTSMTTLGGDASGTVYVGELGAPGPSQGVSSESVIRPGGQPITVTLTSSDAGVLVPVVGGVAQNPNTATIAVGLSRTTYGIRPITSGTAQITSASAQAASPVRAGYPATITVTQPTTSFSLSTTIGAGLTKQASISLQSASPPGGTVITIASSDPSRLVVASSATTVGAGTVDVTVPAGSFSASFWYSGVEGQGGTTAQLSATIQGGLYAAPTPSTITIRPLGIETFGTTFMTTLGGDGFGTVYVGELGEPGPSQGVAGESVIRAGGQPIVVTLTSSAAGIALPVVSGVAQNPNTVTIGVGLSRVNYGVRPVSSGTVQIAATSTSAGTPTRANYPAVITVAQPTTSFSISATVGAGLIKQASINLQSASPPGGTVFTISSSDPARLVLSGNATTVGTGSINVTVPAGSFSAPFWYAGIEGQSGTTEQITAVVQGGLYAAPPAAPITIRPLGVEAFGSTTITTLGGDGFGTVYLGELSPAGPSQSVQGESVIRPGGSPVTVTLTSSTPTVAVPVVAGVAASPRTVTIDPGQSRASYGLRPLVAGTTTIVATSPSAASPTRSGYPATITVSSPSTSISLSTRVGAGLVTQGSLSLQVAAPAGGVTTTITSSDPTRLLLAPNATTAGAASITITIPQGSFSTSFFAMGLEDVTGNPTVSAQTPGYTDATASISVEPIGVQWFGSSALTTLSTDGSGTVYIGIISGVAGNRSVTPEQVIRFGGVTRTITMTSSNPSVVLPVVGGVAQQSITATIAPGQSRATVNVRPIGVGTATIAPTGPGLIPAETPTVPQSVTVTVPTHSVSINTFTLASGLAQNPSLSVQTAIPAGGRTLTLTSSDPTRVLLAPNTTTLGSGQINIAMSAGSFSTSFVVMALEGVTGTVSVTATIPGYRDTTYTFTVVQGGVTLFGPSATRTLAQGDEGFQAQVGVPSGNSVSPQFVRFGAPASLTITLTSSAPSIGTLVVGGVAGSPATVTIPVGESTSTFNAATRANFRPLSAGNTTITATIPGFQQQGNAIRTVTVSP